MLNLSLSFKKHKREGSPVVPMIQVSWLAILVSVIAMFFFGGLWYGPLFGKAWGNAMGMDMSKPKPCAKDMVKPLALQIIGCFLVAYVLTYVLNIWRPSVWNAGADAPNYVYGLSAACWTWIGFYVPLQLSKVGWEMKPWKVFFINAGHDLGNLFIAGMIIAHLR